MQSKIEVIKLVQIVMFDLLKNQNMEESNQIKRYRPIENLHIVFWLIKDLSWCSFSKPIGLVMIFPTIALAIYLAYAHRNDRSEFLHNLAIVCWICANSVWMIGEFYFKDGLRNYAYVLFGMGLSLIAYYYLSEFVFKRKV